MYGSHDNTCIRYSVLATEIMKQISKYDQQSILTVLTHSCTIKENLPKGYFPDPLYWLEP